MIPKPYQKEQYNEYLCRCVAEVGYLYDKPTLDAMCQSAWDDKVAKLYRDKETNKMMLK